MKVRITGRGIYGAEGETPIGTEVVVPFVPLSWARRCTVIEEDGDEEKTLVVNPAEEATKADLIAQAEELGLEVKKNWTKERIQQAIDEKLGE